MGRFMDAKKISKHFASSKSLSLVKRLTNILEVWNTKLQWETQNTKYNFKIKANCNPTKYSKD